MNLHSNTWRTVTSEHLAHLGKTAAQTAETSGMSLTDAVVRSIGMSKLNSEQVRRVVEAANHEAFNRKFAAMDASMRVVELEGGPADPAAVLERLHLAAQPTPVAGFSDYGLEPTPKMAMGTTAPYTTTKTASLSDIRLLNERLKAAHEELIGQVAVAADRVHGSTRKLAGLVKEAVAEGAFHEDFERVWGAVSPKHATEMLSVMRPSRAPAGVKTAGRRISDGHPLITEFEAFVKHAKDYEVACEAVRSVETELVRIDSFFGSVG